MFWVFYPNSRNFEQEIHFDCSVLLDFGLMALSDDDGLDFALINYYFNKSHDHCNCNFVVLNVLVSMVAGD